MILPLLEINAPDFYVLYHADILQHFNLKCAIIGETAGVFFYHSVEPSVLFQCL